MGLLVVSPAGDDEEAHSLNVDIVIVHGLNGNATKTWTNPGTKAFWPSDFLPKDLPEARVFTFEYNASAAFGKTTAGIGDHARILLGSLVDHRQEPDEQKRPLIFIAHSLGGIVVKQALLIAQIDARYAAISEHTTGLIFFGTPHRGSTKATYGKILSQIATALTNSPSSKLISTLQSNSDDLQRLASDFKDQIPRYKIISFYETKPTGPLKSLIVERYSAALDVPEEEQLPVDVNHRDMCKFASRDDQTYQMLWKRLRRIIEACENGQRSALSGEHFNKYYLIPHDVSAIFTGRNDICALLQRQCLPSPSSKQQHRFVLYGLGGSGKTQVALKFAQDHRESFWGIFWIDCSSPQTINESYSKIARECHITEDLDFVKSWLTNSPEAWLLILDNADDPSLNIVSYLPVGSRGTVLITTRNPGLTDLATVGDHEVASMDVKEAVTLLLRVSRLDDDGTVEMASSIAKALGCLALAIVQAGSFIRQNRCTIAEYGEMYARHPRNLLQGPSVRDYKYTIYTTWEISITMIRDMKDETSIHAINLLQLFSFMHFANIPEEIIKRASANIKSFELANSMVSNQFPRLVEGHSRDWNPLLYRNALERLSSFSLITWNKSNTVSMHPLVHTWVRGQLGKAETVQWSGASASILALSIKTENWDGDCKYRRSIISHIVSCLSHVHTKFFTEGDGVDGRLNMMDSFAEAFLENHLLQESATLRERILNARREVYGADSLESLTSVEALARSFYALGRFEDAVDLLEDVLRKKEAILGKQHPDILRSKNILSGGLIALGRYKEALDTQLGTLNAKERTLEQDPEILQSLEILANCYLVSGRPQDALSVAQKLLSFRQSRDGKNHPSVLKPMDLVACCYRDLGRYQEACELGESVLDLRRRILGEESRASLTSISNLSLYYAELGRYEKACSIGEELLITTKRIFGTKHPNTVTAMMRLAAFYHSFGLHRESLNLAEESYELAIEVLGEDHPDSLLSLSQIAGCYESFGRLEEAEARYKTVAEKQSKKLGPDHKATLHTILELASLYSDFGRFQESRGLCEEVLSTRTRRLGKDHPETLYARYILTKTYMELGHEDSEKMAQQLVVSMSMVIGEEHPHSLKCKQLLASCCHNSGRRNEAVEQQEVVVAAMTNILGKQHPSTVKAIEYLEKFRGHRKLSIRKKDKASPASMLSKRSTDIKASSLTVAESVLLNDGTNHWEIGQQEETQKSCRTDINSTSTSEGKPNRRWDVKALLRRR